MTKVILALFSALLLILSFPTFDFHFLAWFALVPFFLAIRNQSLKPALGLSLLSGMAFFMGLFYWINSVKGIKPYHYVILGIYLGSFYALFGFLLHLVSRKTRLPLPLTAPPIWVAVEYLRSNAGFLALPSGLLGHSQYLSLPLIQMAGFTGAYGVSFVLVLVNAAVAEIIVHFVSPLYRVRGKLSPLTLSPPGSGHFLSNSLCRGLFVATIILATWGAGRHALHRDLAGKLLSIAVVQGNVPQEMKWKREFRESIVAKYERLSEEASTSGPRLVIWPESSTPGFILNDLTLSRRIIAMVKRIGAFFVIGSSEYPKFSRELIKFKKTGNTALFIEPNGKILGQYLKIALVPFGEYVPYEGIVPWPEFLVPKGMKSDLPGRGLNLFSLDGIRFATPICSEMMDPDLCRRMVKEGAVFLANISNEAWFGDTAFPHQFLALCVFRAAENRVNVVRATNTGISCFIDPYGRITGRVIKDGKDTFVEGTLTREILLSPPGTFYTRCGDIFAYICIAFSIGLVVWSSCRKSHSA
jgi:apolipoprotein N-acyltransferase